MKINMTNSLYYKNLSTKPKIKGVLIISHGMAEHIGRYEWLISKLNLMDIMLFLKIIEVMVII